MIFRVLGCSGSELDRSHPCSFLVGSEVLVDMGSGASRLTLAEQLSIRHVLLSHAHLDHTKDLAFFAENVFAGRRHVVDVRGTPGTLGTLRAHMFNGALWPDFSLLPSAADPVLRFAPFAAGERLRLGELDVFSVEVDHPGGCVALFLGSATGTIVYSGDTGPTTRLWEEINARPGVRAVLLECSFPNRLAKVAEDSGHLTPRLFAGELAKLVSREVTVYAYHVKAPYRDEILAELEDLQDPRVRVLEPGMRIEF